MDEAFDYNLISAIEYLKKTSFTDFVAKTSPRYMWWWHNRYLCRELEKFTNDIFLGKSPILIIEMPPRSGKSHIASVRFPLWFMSQAPNLEFVLATYGQTLSDKASMQARSLVDSDFYKNTYGNKLVGRKIANWYLSNGSSFRGTGVGGGLTGEGSHCGAIDDPIKNPEMARSIVQKEKQWEWYDTVFCTRLAPLSGQIITLTRWAMDDIAGRLIKRGTDNIKIIRFPAIADMNLDPCDPRDTGEALHPDRYHLKRLKKIKKSLPIGWWSAMYQGNPIPDGGFIVKHEHIRRYVKLPKTGMLYQSWDFTFGSKNKTASYVVGQVWLKTPGGLHYLVDQYRKKIGFNGMLLSIRSMLNKYPYTEEILVEKKAAGDFILENLENQYGERLVKVNPVGDKEERLEACSPIFINKQIFIPDESIVKPDEDGKTWTSKWVTELTEFPASSNDDQVDSTTQYLNYIYDPLSDIIVGDNEDLMKTSIRDIIL